MAAINPYLIFNGNAEEAFNFYKSVIGGEFTMLQRYSDTPSEVPSPDVEGEKIMHVSLPIGEGTILMGSDVPGTIEKAIIGTNFNISINADSEKEAENLFNKLSEGGKVSMPLEKTFWGAYFGMLSDKFGIQWMVNYDYGQQK